MRKFGLIGFPLGHSFSAKYFTEKFVREGIGDCEYKSYPLECIEDFTTLVSGEKELCGLNVTIPYKTEIIRYIDGTEPAISEIGAVNVLKIRRTGNRYRITGYNSDVYGIELSLQPFFEKGIHRALILGTGGSSKAVAYTLRKAGVEYNLVSRTRKNNYLVYSDLTPSILGEADLIVNTTPLGMFPHTESYPAIDYSLLDTNHILFDLVYNPEITTFLRKGKERGCKLIPGTGMLHAQAERSWRIWNDDSL